MDVLIRIVFLGFLILQCSLLSESMSRREKQELKTKVSEMFHHAYRSYMDNAYPADELMPLSCKGRYRGTQPSRGDIDDSLGNFSLTLIDTLDTLVVLGEVDEFERAVRHVIEDIRFDNDIVVSVFETNIRVVGGLLGGHLMADFLKQKKKRMLWYNDELLKMAQDLGDRLLPAFNTSTGMPYPRVNLRYGVKHEMSRTGSEKDTCTACAGTMLLEFSALSRLTGNKIYEMKASRSMDYLWESRHRSSDLVGTVINIHNGDWVRRESGIGAGIDSYYEYLLKGYIMLGKDTYLDRFNKHYKAVMKYISNGPLMLDVHMHRPQMNSRNFMDALLAFWPGLQVLKGDLKSAIEIHEMLYQVTLRHNFLPEAFTADFRVHWAQHPLRPEFLESTYFLYKATGDPYYLEVGKSMIENLDRHARVPCGFAAIKDVTTGSHEDQMDSYFLAETFKYLYLLFSEKEDLILNVDEYVFTTEAHLLPLFLSLPSSVQNFTEDADGSAEDSREDGDDEEYDFHNTCPSTNHLFKGKIDFAHHLRSPLKNLVENLCPKPRTSESRHLKAADFIAGNKDQVVLLSRMGIRIITMSDGRVQLLHLSNEASSPEDSADGLLFMQEMVELSKAQTSDGGTTPLEPRVVQLMSPPYFGSAILKAGPAQFGVSLKNHKGIEGPLAVAAPLKGCQPLSNSGEVTGKFVMVERGDCMFVDKARHLQDAGAIGGIIFDNNSQSSADSSPLFSMSGDGKSDVIIPLVFLFRTEANAIQEAFTDHPNLVVYVGERHKKPEDVLLQYLSYQSHSLTFKPQESPGSGDDLRSLNMEFTGFSSLQNIDSKTEFDLEAGIRDLIVLLLRKINLEHLKPFIKTRTREKLDARIGGSFPVRVIRMPDGSKDTVQMETGSDEEAQHVVRVVFMEFLMLVLECTNLRQLRDLNQIVDAFARLTENVFTGGRMGFGVHTEMLIDEIKDLLVVAQACSSAPLPAVPNALVYQEDGTEKFSVDESSYSNSQNNVPVKMTVTGDDLEGTESQELQQIVSKFVEDQLGILVKELMVTSTSSVKVVIASETQSSCESSQGSLFLEGYRLQDQDPLDEIKHQLNSASDGKSVTVAQMPSDVTSNDDVITICDPDTIVDDVSKVKISETTGEPVWQDSHNIVWKHRNGCWQMERKSSTDQIALNENVASNEIVVNEDFQSNLLKRTADGILDESSSENSELVGDEVHVEEQDDQKSDEELIIEYDTEMSSLEQRLRSSDDHEFYHLADEADDHEDDEILIPGELPAEEGEDVKFWEMQLRKEHMIKDDILDTNFKNDDAHVLDLQLDDKNQLTSRVPLYRTASDDTGSLNSQIQAGDEESYVPNTFDSKDANSPELAHVRSSHDYTYRLNSEKRPPLDSLHDPDPLATNDADKSRYLDSRDFESGDSQFAVDTDAASTDTQTTDEALRTRK